MQPALANRVVEPIFRRLLHILGMLAPKRNVEMTQQMLVMAGEPRPSRRPRLLWLAPADCRAHRRRLLYALGASQSITVVLRNGLIFAALGFFLPTLWLRRRMHHRQHDIQRELPDTLDMLRSAWKAGLAFKSALLKVGERWDNPLTQEFRRAVPKFASAPRDLALKRMAERSGVQELSTFVAVLVQSNRLGVSIADVLHGQAAEMRIRRRRARRRACPAGWRRQNGLSAGFPDFSGDVCRQCWAPPYRP